MAEWDIKFARGFSLHEALAMLEEDDVNAESITSLPSNNACGNITDEDSSDEDQLDINNLPSSMIQNQEEVNIRVNEEDWSSEDELPQNTLQNKEKPKDNLKTKKKKVYQFFQQDLPVDDYVFPEENTFTNLSTPTELFEYFLMMKSCQCP
ncbi:hypothetical protein WA026_019132 [Henosepilachna vigintioctopunctata]|uniref:Uncharacterized protein n=1 Tax=Henosepilachna vigintioctopunctata TaxID=420089 RepID=A0AAW1V4S5_9CUCU